MAMYPSLTELSINAAFPTIKAGTEACGIHAVELVLSPAMEVSSIDGGEKRVLDSEAAIESYARHLEEHGIRPAGFLLGPAFTPTGDASDGVDWIVAALRAADALGMAAIRIDSILRGDSPEVTVEQRTARFVELLKQVIDRTSDLDVGLGIENHGAGGNNLDFLLGVFEGVGSDRVGSTMDMGNFYWSGKPLSEVYETLERLAPHTKHTHVKNINYPEEKRDVRRPTGWEYGRYCCPIEDGDIDLARVIGYLKEAGYEGDLSIEDESIGRFPEAERPNVLVRDAAYLKRVVAELL